MVFVKKMKFIKSSVISLNHLGYNFSRILFSKNIFLKPVCKRRFNTIIFNLIFRMLKIVTKFFSSSMKCFQLKIFQKLLKFLNISVYFFFSCISIILSTKINNKLKMEISYVMRIKEIDI